MRREVFSSDQSDPVMGAYENLVNSGGLAQIRNDALRSDLAAFAAMVKARYAEEFSTMLYPEFNRAFMGRLGWADAVLGQGLGVGGAGREDRAGGRIWNQEAISDPGFQDHLTLRFASQRELAAWYRELAEQGELVLEWVGGWYGEGRWVLLRVIRPHLLPLLWRGNSQFDGCLILLHPCPNPDDRLPLFRLNDQTGIIAGPDPVSPAPPAMPGTWLTRTWAHDPAAHAPPKYRRACRYEAFLPDPLSRIDPRLPAATAGVVSEAEAAIRTLNASAQPALAPLGRLLLRTESIASSKVEGMRSDARDLARAEARRDLGRRLGRETAEVLANIDAMELALDESAAVERFSQAEILAIHRRLMTGGVGARLAGRIRDGQNWIGGNDYNPCGADFVPPPVENVPGLLKDLCLAIDDDLLPPIVQAALVHAQFETIHPFDDGNGRTGRALIHVVLRRRGLATAYVPPISVVLANQRDRYIQGLTRYRGEEVETWIEQFAAGAYTSARLASGYLEAVRALIDRWRDRLAASDAPRGDAAAWAVIDVLPAHPVITAPGAVAATGRGRSQVYRAMQQLEDAGILIPLSESARNRAWEASDLLDLLAGLEAGEPLRG